MNIDFELDFAIHKWSLAEQMAFERAVGMTVYKAYDLLPDEGQEFDVPAAVVAGFTWIAARRKSPDITFDEVANQVSLEDFMEAFERLPEPNPPLANREQRRSTAKSSARSATTSTTRPRKSAA